MRVVFVEQPSALPAPPQEGRVAVIDVAFAGGDNFETSTVPFLEALGPRLAIWIDHHEHPVGWARYKDDPRFVLVPNREAHACPELVTPEIVKQSGAVDVVVAHADFDGLLGAVKFIKGGVAPWPEADEDARATDSPGRGHKLSARSELYADALAQAQEDLRTPQREQLRQDLVQALVSGTVPEPLKKKLQKLQEAHREALRPVEELARGAREEAKGVLVARVEKALPRPVKKALLSRLEDRVAVGVVVEGKAVTAATYDERIDLGRCDELPAGRSDYRFGTTTDGGQAVVSRLGSLVREAVG